MTKVCSKTAIWIFVLMLIAPGSTLTAEDPPSVQDRAVQETHPAAATPVPPALHQALASSLDEASSISPKVIPPPPTGTWGIVSEGDGGGGIFRDSDSEAEAWLGTGGIGVLGYGTVAGGYFKDSDHSGYAYVANGNYGIGAYGDNGGGYFTDTNGSGIAFVGFGDYGIQANGNSAGGYFFDADGSGNAYVGTGEHGIRAFGILAGGYFKNTNQSGYASIGHGHYGIKAYGTTAGGYFEDSDGTGYANVASGGHGIAAYGNSAGGYFFDADESGYAYVANGDLGIRAWGSKAGGHFFDIDDSCYAHVASGGNGIDAYGDAAGGYFNDTNGLSWARVAHDGYKIYGVGAVSFVQNHPYDPSSVIVYAAPEGDEVATYTRGTARLVEGEATVQLGETFKWVTNPDLGLTAYLTSVGEWCDLYIAEKATNQITVRSRDGADCTFDFLVYGLRIGFEELSIVQEKEHESYIPSMSNHRQLYERRPDLKSYNSLERFKGMRRVTNPKAKLDLTRAQALRDAIIEFDPAIHELPRPPGFEEMTREDGTPEIEGHQEEVQSGERVRATRTDQGRRPVPGHFAINSMLPVDDEGNVYATSFRPSSQDLASFVDVSEEVQPGDVLVVDKDHRGLMRRGSSAADNGVVGIVAAGSEVALGSDAEFGETKAPEEPDQSLNFQLKAPVAFSGVVDCKVDASYGAVWTGNLLVTSPTPGHAMAQQAPLPGTVLGKALEPLENGAGTIKVLVMLR